MFLQSLFIVVNLAIIRTTISQNFYVAAPDTFRLNANVTVAVAIEGNNGEEVQVFVQDHPGKIKNISQVTFSAQDGIPALINIRLDPADFPLNFLNAPGSQKLVSLTVKTDRFTKEILIPISTQSGYVFIQTDKPIYTPKQRAHIRIISLSEEVFPSYKVFKLQIKNPRGIVVEEKLFNQKAQQQKKAIASHFHQFSNYPFKGEWSATVLFGPDFQQNSTAYFDVEEYVLPIFTVELKTPDIILPSTPAISIGVVVKNVHGKKFEGIATFRLGVKGESAKTTFFAVLGPKELTDGSHYFTIKTDDLKNHKDIGWFPQIEGSRLVVKATVLDMATGKKKFATDAKARFSKSPFQISFKRCLQDFKPGLVSVFEADVNYIDGRPAQGITTKVKVTVDGKPLDIIQDFAVSDENGKVTFEFQPDVTHNTVSITLKTDDPRYADNQAVGNFVQRKYQSLNKAYIALERSTPRKLQPEDMFTKTVHIQPAEIKDIYYLMAAKGKIIAMNKLSPSQYKAKQIEFQITQDMVPNFRVLVFAHYGNELLADSLKIEVDRLCDPKATVSIEPQFSIPEPGNFGKILIRGTKGTLVGLLGVDEAVYDLSKKDLLTKAKVFETLAKHDLGCGPGGGLTVDSVLGNTGITIGTNKYTPTLSHTCVEIKRRKREAAVNIANTYTGYEKQCCSHGIEHDEFERSCEERVSIFTSQLEHPEIHCTKAYLDCCIYAREKGITEMKMSRKTNRLVRNSVENFDHVDFIPIEDQDVLEKRTTVRSDFKETWIFEDILIGPDNRKEYEVRLPHSITTWVIQAVSVSDKHGVCIAEPQKVVSVKKIFIHLNLPYSVVRNEQAEVQATVFNYGDKNISAVVYMYGAKHLCSGMQPGKKSERKYLVIKAHSAKTTNFPVIPLKVGQFPIKVVVLTSEGSDVIEKKLRVVFEGVTQEIDIPIKLDPTNQQHRALSDVITDNYEDTLNPARNLQVTSVKLSVPEGFVPGTARGFISVIGDQFGLAVETTINNPNRLLKMPGGCGEQNMMNLAPTLYTMRYFKMTGKLAADKEQKAYEFMRYGYDNQLSFRKEDGSYATFQKRPTSTWLTAFVMKVFCQAKELIYIDENVLCSGVKWLIKNQEEDGSYLEKRPVLHSALMGGVKGKNPMTAFTLITLEECNCDEKNLLVAKKRAVSYLERHLGEVDTPLPAAITAYALALSGSELKNAAKDKLMSMAKLNEDTNTMFWTTHNSAEDIETAGYALLTQLLHNNMVKSTSIVNWLNTKQLKSGSFKSTQDTVVALQALSEYAIRVQRPSVNLMCNISSSNVRNFHKFLSIHEGNAFVMQTIKVKVGDTIFINTSGHGVGTLAATLRYKLIVPPEQISKFYVSVNVTDAQKMEVTDPFIRTPLFKGPSRSDVPIDDLESYLYEEKPQENNKVKYKITICARYLGNEDAEMSIVDVGIFSGFEPIIEDLKQLEENPNHLILRYEKSSRGIVFYLQKVPTTENYCFEFHVIRVFNVGNTQMSVIKVYDYYNPDEVTTIFYSPAKNSSILRTNCKGGICECAEVNCPRKIPFAETASMARSESREKLRKTICEKFDYVWKGRLNEPNRREGEFWNISFAIEEVIIEGIEKRKVLEGETRTLLISANCDSLRVGQTYLLMGKDGEQFKNANGLTWYRYILDGTSGVYVYGIIKEAGDIIQQRALNSLTNDLHDIGCSG